MQDQPLDVSIDVLYNRNIHMSDSMILGLDSGGLKRVGVHALQLAAVAVVAFVAWHSTRDGYQWAGIGTVELSRPSTQDILRTKASIRATDTVPWFGHGYTTYRILSFSDAPEGVDANLGHNVCTIRSTSMASSCVVEGPEGEWRVWIVEAPSRARGTQVVANPVFHGLQ